MHLHRPSAGLGPFGPAPLRPYARAYAYAYRGLRAFASLSMARSVGTINGSGGALGFSINNLGQATGFSTSSGGGYHAFLYDNGVMQDLGTLGGTNSYGRDINDSGQTVGLSDISGDTEEHAFLYSNGVMQDLGTLGGTTSWALGANNSGQVVGWSYDANGESAAFFYDGSTMIDLCVYASCRSAGWDYLGAAIEINESGEMVGYGVNNGLAHAFIVTTLPIPTTLWLFGSGLVGLVGMYRRNKCSE